MGMFAGKRPAGLGFTAGKFKAPSWRPNCVSSTVAASDSHYIAPMVFSGDAVRAWQKLLALLGAQQRASLVEQQAAYLRAEFKTATMGFVDDVEFALDAKANAIQVRSASRLGVRDFGVNRRRIESLRAGFSQAN